MEKDSVEKAKFSTKAEMTKENVCNLKIMVKNVDSEMLENDLYQLSSVLDSGCLFSIINLSIN